MAQSVAFSKIDEVFPESQEVIFTVVLSGKAIGEFGLLNQELTKLNWSQFKSYLSNAFPDISSDIQNIEITYRDEEGDEVPIDSDTEFFEAVKVSWFL